MKLNILDKVRTIAVTCVQFGDTAKGKIVDLLAAWAEIIARGTGGANAGHSVCLGEESFIFHLIPSGILHDKDGKTNIIGSGTAIDPRILCEELALLDKKEISYDKLMLALNAKLTLPTQIVRDRVGEGEAGDGKIGTTGRGIGPTYGDHVIRIGLLVNDLLNRDILAAKVKANVAFSVRILKSYDPEMVKAILQQPYLDDGLFYHSKNIFDVDTIVSRYYEYGRILSPFIFDTDHFIQHSVGVHKILLEGAQGALLDVDYGTQPYVTSSNCTVDGLAKGVGLNRSHIDLSLGIFKGFYETRVGGGPFPTELGGEVSARWCRTASQEEEAAQFAGATVNDEHDEFRQGVALRIAGREYGVTTKRPRRTGWLDLPLLKYALQWNGPDVVLTKLDVLDECRTIKVCVAYEYQGPHYRFGNCHFNAGDRLLTAIPSAEFLQHCRPVYRSFPGWQKSIRGIRSFYDLPSELRAILSFLVAETHIRPIIISVGPDREETIFT